ncbi:UNVERIFIED_CONTAM: movement protein [Sesamum indicum]
MLQPLHPYGAILNLDIINFRNTEKLIDEWVAAIKIATTTLELDIENFIKLVELSLEGSIKIGWDNTPEDTKASILAGDSKGAIADRLGRLIKIHFIRDRYFEGSRAEKAREYAQALFSLELRRESGEPRKRRKQSSDSYPWNSRRTFSRRRSWWSKSKARTYKSGRRAGPKGFHPTDLHEQRQDLPEEPPQEELSDEPIPEQMKVSKTTIVGPVEQKDIYPPTSHRNMVNYKNLKPQMTSWMQSTMATWIGGIGKVLNQIGLNQRKHHIIYKVSSGEFAIPMELTGNVMEMQLIPKEEILEELSKLREEVTVTMKWIHIGTIEVVIKTTFKEGIDSEIHLSIMDRRINNLRDSCLGTMIGNLYAGKLMFDIHPRYAYNLADQDFSRVLTLHQDFKRKGLMKEGNRPYSITYRIAYALSNTHHSDLFLRKEYIEIPRIFKEFAKVMTPDPIRIPRIGGVDIIIKDHPVLDRTLSSRTEFSSRMSFSEDRIIGYKGKEKELLKVLTQEIRVDNVKLRCPQGWKEIQVIFDITKKENYFPCDNLYHLQQPVVGKYEGMLEIAGHKILVAGVAGRENGIMTLELSFLEDHKPWGRKGIFIKDLARYRKDFRPLLKETESSKWKWEQIHNKRVHELKQVCSNLPKLAILQDGDELVVYTDANDYRWATMLMKKTTTGKNPVDIPEGCSQNNRPKFDI